MQNIQIILGYICNSLRNCAGDYSISNPISSISFLDDHYPRALYPYIYIVPIIYYRGNISFLNNCSCILRLDSPSYYVQKVQNQLRSKYRCLAISILSNSITKISYLCDIIYCNDIEDINNYNANLVFSINISLTEIHQLELIAVLISKLFVLEGFPDSLNFSFISSCIDNNVEVSALPSNIFISGSSLPNILLDKGINPLLLN